MKLDLQEMHDHLKKDYSPELQEENKQLGDFSRLAEGRLVVGHRINALEDRLAGALEGVEGGIEEFGVDLGLEAVRDEARSDQ